MRPSHCLRVLLLLVCCSLYPAFALAAPESLTPIPLAALKEQARKRQGEPARVALAAKDAEIFRGAEPLNYLGAPEPPNYLRALAVLPNAVKPFSELLSAALYAGQLEPEIKMAMGLRMAQLNNSPYVAAHIGRLLRATPRGQKLLAQLEAADAKAWGPSDALALEYADSLTRNIHGVSDAAFQKVSAVYNDSQLVEMTMTVCFFNYFTRMAEAFHLPVESWAFDAPQGPPAPNRFAPPPARIALISDEEINVTGEVAAAAKDTGKPTNSLGLGVANSQRAMLRSPAFARAWRAYGAIVREYATVNRETKLQISFAVSMANGCRYCTLHQVLGLRRLGVDPAKLLAMNKSDAALTPRELTAVAFARKLTREPSSVTDEDYVRLKTEFTEQGAVEVVLQTAAFAFMNRFTDGLRLPSEDEAIRVYRETYGQDFEKAVAGGR